MDVRNVLFNFDLMYTQNLVIKYPFWGGGGGGSEHFQVGKKLLERLGGEGGDFIINVCVFVFSFDHLHVT